MKLHLKFILMHFLKTQIRDNFKDECPMLLMYITNTNFQQTNACNYNKEYEFEFII